MVARQFDVCRLREPGGAVDLVVVLQADALSDSSTVVVAPLIEVGALPELGRATPVVVVGEVPYLAAVHLVMTIHRRSLGTTVQSLAGSDWPIKAAVDAVFFGV